MSMYQASAGPIYVERFHLTNSLQAIDVSGGKQATLPKMRLVNLTASPVAVDIEIHTATASWSILKGAPVPANGTVEILDEFLGMGEILKAKAASNNAIDLHIMAGIIR